MSSTDKLSRPPVGFALFDPPRLHRKTAKKYAFWSHLDESHDVTSESVFLNKQTCRDRFVDKLQRAAVLSGERGDTARATIHGVLLDMIIQDELAILAKINDSLDSIDLAMSNDEFLSRMVDTWRERFGQWRNLLSHARSLIGYLSCAQGAWGSIIPCGGSGAHATPDRLRSLQYHAHSTNSRVDSTFQAFTSTMSIIESGKAIREAETVAKLTRLAFFFVPPTLITGVFGANISV